jgi:hypothetical protein
VFEKMARIFVDPKELPHLHGTTLDYPRDLMKQGFVSKILRRRAVAAVEVLSPPRIPPAAVRSASRLANRN